VLSVKQVCKDVGWHGGSFYCLRCGKAGFQSEAQARGHLAQCKGRAIQRGVLHSPVGVAPDPNLSGGQILPLAVGGAGAHTYQLGGSAPGGSGGGQTSSISPDWYTINQRMATLENTVYNENYHLLMQRNLQPAGFSVGDWFFHNKGFIIISAVALLILLAGRDSSCECPDGSKGVSKSKVGGLGQKALSKLTDRAISKSIDSLFK